MKTLVLLPDDIEQCVRQDPGIIDIGVNFTDRRYFERNGPHVISGSVSGHRSMERIGEEARTIECITLMLGICMDVLMIGRWRRFGNLPVVSNAWTTPRMNITTIGCLSVLGVVLVIHVG